MAGGTSEVHLDSEPLVELDHQGATGSSAFVNTTQPLSMFVRIGLYAENSTTGAGGTVSAVTDTEISISWSDVGSDINMNGQQILMGDNEPYFGTTTEWTNGDTLKVYKTATKNGIISTQWTDRSRGWKMPKRELVGGWRLEDIDERYR